MMLLTPILQRGFNESAIRNVISLPFLELSNILNALFLVYTPKSTKHTLLASQELLCTQKHSYSGLGRMPAKCLGKLNLILLVLESNSSNTFQYKCYSIIKDRSDLFIVPC